MIDDTRVVQYLQPHSPLIYLTLQLHPLQQTRSYIAHNGKLVCLFTVQKHMAGRSIFNELVTHCSLFAL